MSPTRSEVDVEVAALEVGRIGIPRLAPVEVNVEESPEDVGHDDGPQARSVRQQPPPRLEGQERKPE